MNPLSAHSGGAPEFALILAGGGGTRFWPLSTEARPKQFLSLMGDASMLQESVARLEGLVPPERILVLTGERFVSLTREQLPERHRRARAPGIRRRRSPWGYSSPGPASGAESWQS